MTGAPQPSAAAGACDARLPSRAWPVLVIARSNPAMTRVKRDGRVKPGHVAVKPEVRPQSLLQYRYLLTHVPPRRPVGSGLNPAAANCREGA
jgi:hypothetical protein